MWETFEGLILARTNKGVLFEGNYWEGALWFPVSQVILEEDGEGSYVMKVKDWLAKKRGCFEFTYYSLVDIERIAES